MTQGESSKRWWKAFILAAIMPGMGQVYLGGPHRKQGWLNFAGFLLCFPLVLAFGLGLFFMPFAWLSSVTSVFTAWWRRNQG